MDNEIKIIDGSQGDILAVAGDNYRIVIGGTQTNNTYSVIDMYVPPGGGPTPHYHHKLQEFFYVIEGELTYKTEAAHVVVKAGGLVHIPYGGGIHCFHNNTDKIAHVLCVVMPSGMEDVFMAVGVPAKAGEFLPGGPLTPETKAKLEELNKKFDQVIYPPDYLDK